jgi:hypothetical protein
MYHIYRTIYLNRTKIKNFVLHVLLSVKVKWVLQKHTASILHFLNALSSPTPTPRSHVLRDFCHDTTGYLFSFNFHLLVLLVWLWYRRSLRKPRKIWGNIKYRPWRPQWSCLLNIVLDPVLKVTTLCKVTTAWRILRFRMEEMASRYGG